MQAYMGVQSINVELYGFKEAIGAVYPDARIQRCVIHMLRNSFKYVNYSDLRKFSADFKSVYNAPNELGE